MFRNIGLGILALLLVVGVATQAQTTQAQLDAYQSIAESYYVAGVNENALLGNARNAFDALIPGMIGPDFTLLDLDGNAYTLSQYRGEQFVVLITGSWY